MPDVGLSYAQTGTWANCKGRMPSYPPKHQQGERERNENVNIWFHREKSM